MKFLLLVFMSSALFAQLHVVTTFPYISELTKIVAKERVEVTTLAKGSWDPHFVVAKPSLINRVRKADLLIMNGAQLEIGWLPPLIRQAHNAKIQDGSKGFLNLSTFVQLQDVRESVSRSEGDVHPEGNPHYICDPYNVEPLLNAISNRLAQLDPQTADFYFQNRDSFLEVFHLKLQEWSSKMQALKGKNVVQYHELFNYFITRYGVVNVAFIEPKPGITPSSRHTLDVINIIKSRGVKAIFQDVYHSEKVAKFIASKSGAKVLLMPHDVGALDEVDDIVSLYETLVDSALKVMQ